MQRQTVVRHAPGKLFVLGEYAVLEPGRPSILVAINRQITVAVSQPALTPVPPAANSWPADAPAADVIIASDLEREEVRLRRTGGRLVGCTASDDRRARTALAHVVFAIEVLGDLLAERRLPTPAMRVEVTSGLHENGTKLGLGSSGAVTVATVTAVAHYCGITLSDIARYRLAMIATARISTNSSGGDLAAGVWGGWLAYYAPDRDDVLDMTRRRGVVETLRAPWPEFGLRRLPPPDGLVLQVGWTGTPASTASLSDGHNMRTWRGSKTHRSFLDRMTGCVRASMRALTVGDKATLLDEIRAARQLLARVDSEACLGVFTSELTALCEITEHLGGAAKPSGAGGGDCGIALLDAPTPADIARLRAAWTAAGLRPLDLHVPPLDLDDAPGGTT